VLLWYVGMSVLLVANVFRSVGVDYRLVAVGSLLPLLVDLPFGERAFGHTLLFPVALLVVVMLATIGRPRLLRRRLLCLPIGVFAGLVLSGAFTQGDTFFWPLFGTDFPGDPLLPEWWVVVLEELVGLVACWWVVGQFDLYLPGPRAEFLHTGRLQETTPP
jgi:membrane-bound metal-dependent hydrolase YbcI (DUF457 family)